MISVIVYGRNDAHGYNLHRRAALSLNCLAEVLTDPDDEIIFVDYNTSDELPTLVEALSDTLTDRCLKTLRVLRIPASIHEQRFAARTHLVAIEPVSRNAAARRANPSNRWLLSTNTDMILLPLTDQSLSEICTHLPDGFYGLPRFELPEWLWEHLPRSDPGRTMAEIARLGPALRLDEQTLSYEWIRFDAPGDFQLILREDFCGIDGFNEEMLIGWHVDSNLSRRMYLRRGPILSLEEHLAGYHCNHNRTPTVFHGEKWIANDLDQFFFSVNRAELPGQRETWGLAHVALEDVRVQKGVEPLATIVREAIPQDGVPPAPVDARDSKFSQGYDSGHVLSFVADSLVMSPTDATIGYIGANPVLECMLATVVAGLELGGPLAVAKLDDQRSVGELDQITDVFVIDLGVDASYIESSPLTPNGNSSHLRSRLTSAFDAFQQIVELERARIVRGDHPRRFVLINSSAAFWNSFVLAELHCSPTTAHSRVRFATVKLHPDDDEETRAAHVRALRLGRWTTRRDARDTRINVHSGEALQIADLDDFGGFGDGWAYPDRTAVWTEGPRSELAIDFHNAPKSASVLELTVGRVGVPREGSLSAELFINGVQASNRTFGRADHEVVWSVPLSRQVLAEGTADLTVVIVEPVSWLDDRRLGLHLNSIAIRKTGWRRRLDDVRYNSAPSLKGRVWRRALRVGKSVRRSSSDR